MRKVMLGAGLMVLILAVSGLAMAQDEETFKGFYVGGTVGGVPIGRADATTSMLDQGFCTPCVNAVNAAGIQHSEPTGFYGGFDAGYGWRTGNWMIGLEGDFGALHAQDTSRATFPLPLGKATASISQNVKSNWLFTARPRVGYVAGKWMVYATAGAAAAHITYAANYTDTFAGATESGRFTDSTFGWTAGGGVEYQAGKHWSLKGEWLYADFGDVGGTSNNFKTTTFSDPKEIFTHNANLRVNILRGGLHYYF